MTSRVPPNCRKLAPRRRNSLDLVEALHRRWALMPTHEGADFERSLRHPRLAFSTLDHAGGLWLAQPPPRRRKILATRRRMAVRLKEVPLSIVIPIHNEEPSILPLL